MYGKKKDCKIYGAVGENSKKTRAIFKKKEAKKQWHQTRCNRGQ